MLGTIHFLSLLKYAVVFYEVRICICEVGCHYSLDWTTGLEYWTGLLD